VLGFLVSFSFLGARSRLLGDLFRRLGLNLRLRVTAPKQEGKPRHECKSRPTHVSANGRQKQKLRAFTALGACSRVARLRRSRPHRRTVKVESGACGAQGSVPTE